MKFRDLSFIVMVVVIASGLQALSLVNKPPAMPEDLHHATVSRDVSAQCLRCHRAETMLALEQTNRHPAKWRDARSDCLLCHLPPGGVKREAEPGARRTPCAILKQPEWQWLTATTR